MRTVLQLLLERLDDKSFASTNIIPWSCPIPSFGDMYRSQVATLGLNPSNREFVDARGRELDGELRRFHTLKSLGLIQWSDAGKEHLQLIADSCRMYFNRNPYDGWFKCLDYIIAGTKTSYYDKLNTACHLDLIPYATACKWTDLTTQQRKTLIRLAGDTLGVLLRDATVRILILNGRTVVESLQSISGITFDSEEVKEWALHRKSGYTVKGYAYKGTISELAGINLKRNIRILGFNHNIQGSFGVTSLVKSSIRKWLARAAKE